MKVSVFVPDPTTKTVIKGAAEIPRRWVILGFIRSVAELNVKVNVEDGVVAVVPRNVDIPSLFGDLPLDSVVYGCDWWLWRRWPGGSYRPWWDVRSACGYQWLPRGDEGLSGGNHWLAWRWGDPPRRQRWFGSRCGFRSCGWCYWNNGEDPPWSHWWTDGGGPPVIDVWDVVVVVCPT